MRRKGAKGGGGRREENERGRDICIEFLGTCLVPPGGHRSCFRIDSTWHQQTGTCWWRMFLQVLPLMLLVDPLLEPGGTTSRLSSRRASCTSCPAGPLCTSMWQRTRPWQARRTGPMMEKPWGGSWQWCLFRRRAWWTVQKSQPGDPWHAPRAPHPCRAPTDSWRH